MKNFVQQIKSIESLSFLGVLLEKFNVKQNEVTFYRNNSNLDNERAYQRIKAQFPEEDWDGDDGSFYGDFFAGETEYCFSEDCAFRLTNPAFREIDRSLLGFFGVFIHHEKRFNRSGSVEFEEFYRKAIIILPTDFTNETAKKLIRMNIKILKVEQ